MSSLVGFSAWIAATFVFARRFVSLRRPGWAIFSPATGALLLLMFLGSAPAAVPVMGLVIAIALAWVWLSANSAKLLAEEAQSTTTPSPALTRIIREPNLQTDMRRRSSRSGCFVLVPAIWILPATRIERATSR